MKKGKPWLLAMDLDGTLWDHLDISTVSPPYYADGKGRLRSVDGTTIQLYSDAVNFVKWCKRNGAKVTTLSWNKPEYVFQALKVLKVTDLFDFHGTEFTEEKHERLLDLLNKLRRSGIVIPPHRIVYVDDRDIHIGNIRRRVGDVVFIHIWEEVSDYDAAISIVRKEILEDL
jgi:magnesium-dependent phosphatase-1